MSARPVAYAAALVAILSHGAGTQTLASASSGSDSARIFSGVYASTFDQSIFSPCDVPGIGSGWSLRFKNERDGAFIRYSYGVRGMPTLAHFIRVRGRLSALGRFGLGFQTREIVVDSLLEIKETPQPCASYEDLPQPWSAIDPSVKDIGGAALTDDAQIVATIDRDAVISVWNARRGALIQRFPSNDAGDLMQTWQLPMAFTHDGKRLAVGNADGVLRIWNPLNGELLHALPSLDSMEVAGQKRPWASERMEFNHSGTLLASAAGPRVAIWSTVDGKLVGTFKTRNYRFVDDTSFMVTGDSGVVSIYPRLSAAPVSRIQTPVKSLGLIERSQDGRWLFVSRDDTAYLMAMVNTEEAQAIVIPGWNGTTAVAFSADGNTLAVAGGSNGLYLWDTKTGTPLRAFQKFPMMSLSNIWFAADGKSIVTRSVNDTVLRIVHIDEPSRTPVQAWWPSDSPAAREMSGRSYGSIFGYVKDSTKMGVMGADVWVYDGDHSGSSPIAHTSTNNAGRYLIQSIKVPHVTLRAGKPGLVTAEKHIHLLPWENTVDLELKR
jgi:WD40 repeat protein